MRTQLCLTTAVVLTLAGVAQGGDEETATYLTIGDAAKPLEISHWLKGEEIKAFEPGKVYVVEFWATWCGPCKMSMPHITSLQQKYQDYGVRFVGISDEPLQTVVTFLTSVDKKDNNKLWSDKIGYTLATDPDESVKNDYFKAAGQSGIPTAFIVGKDAKIEWIGHPMSIDEPLDAVVKDEWDRAAAKDTWEKEQAAERAMMKTQTALREARRAKDWDKVVALLDEQIAANPENPFIQFTKFSTLLRDMNQPEKAYAMGDTLLKNAWDEAMMLNQVAWFVVDDAGVQKRDLDFAHKAAARAVELSPSDAAILDTLARCQFEKGDVKAAVATQKKAVELAQDGELKAQLEEALKKYEAKLSSR